MKNFHVVLWAPWHLSPTANWPVFGLSVTQESRQLCGRCSSLCAVQSHHQPGSSNRVWSCSQNSKDTVTVAGLTLLWFLEFLLPLLSTCLVKNGVFNQQTKNNSYSCLFFVSSSNNNAQIKKRRRLEFWKAISCLAGIQFTRLRLTEHVRGMRFGGAGVNASSLAKLPNVVECTCLRTAPPFS